MAFCLFPVACDDGRWTEYLARIESELSITLAAGTHCRRVAVPLEEGCHTMLRISDDQVVRTSGVVMLALALLLLAGHITVSQAQAEGETIPEAIARGARGRTSTEHSGRSPSVAEILMSADLVVRGIVGEPRSYLSSDKRDVYTDYALLSPAILYQRTQRTSEKPGPLGITITQLGGKVLVGNVEFTQTELGLPPLMPGTEGIFILEERGGRYHIARTFYGAFGIVANKVKPLTSKRDFAPEYREAPVATVLADLRSRLSSSK